MPDNGFAPLQPPDAAHAETLVADHVNVVVAPSATPAGEAVSVRVGDRVPEVALELEPPPPQPTTMMVKSTSPQRA